MMTIKKISRQKLIDNASKLFSVQGYHYTSIADIAESCQLSKGSLYHYIDSKLDLGEAVIRSAHDYFQKNFFTIANDVANSPQQRFEDVINAIYQHFESCSGSALLLSMAAEVVNSVPEFVEPLRNFFTQWRRVFKELLTHFFEAELADQHARRMLCELQGAVLFGRLFNEADTLKLWKQENLQLVAETAVAA